MKTVKQTGNLMRGNAHAGIAHAQFHRVAHLLQANRNLPLKREFKRVGDRIENDLLPHVAVDVGQLFSGMTIDDQLQAGLFSS